MASTSRLNVRTLLLIFAEALLIFLAMVTAAYLRLGWSDAYFELNEKYGFDKAALVTLFCLAAFYLYDLYDFVVMHDRRELVLRLVQALGLAWVALAIAMYLLPQLIDRPRRLAHRAAAGARADGRLARRRCTGCSATRTWARSVLIVGSGSAASRGRARGFGAARRRLPHRRLRGQPARNWSARASSTRASSA